MIRHRAFVVTFAALLGLQATEAARADADEAWLHRADLPAGLHPLLVLVLDNSAAAARTVLAAPAYDPDRDYAASLPAELRCDPARVYWRRGPGPAPDCLMQDGLAGAGSGSPGPFQCHSARAALSQLGYFVASRAAQWRGDGADGRWVALDAAATGAVECRADRSVHGAEPGVWYAADGTLGPWSVAVTDEIRWDRSPLADPYVFYIGNYLNYLRAALAPREISISDLARQALAGALRATDGLDAALLRFGEVADGAFVVRAAVPAARVAEDLEAATGAAPVTAAPLAEALSETAAWLAGEAVRFGRDAAADTGAFDATGMRYESPYRHACRPVTVAVATAGLASGDESAAGAAAALPGFFAATGGCGADCLAPLAQFMDRGDLRGELPGRQAATVHWLTRLPAAAGIAAAAASGSLSRIEDPHAYVELIARAQQHDAAVPAGPRLSAPGLIVASPTAQDVAAVYALSAPGARQRWSGNLLRYGLRAPDSPLSAPVIVDRDGEPAIDAESGLPYPASRSVWSDSPDSNLLAGAAAGRLPAPTERRVHADLVSQDIGDLRNRLAPGNPLLERPMLGLGAADSETPDEVIAWVLAARPLGDPGLHAPTVVNYPGEDLAIAFVATQDGLLQAFDAASGVERWAWIPRTLLPRLAGLMRDEATTARSHGIDGPLVVHRFDPDGDGRIDSSNGEHLWLMFGPGRGGDAWFALDIADPDAPRLMWMFSPPGTRDSDFGPEPVVARLATGDSLQSAGHWIVMVAAGRDLYVLDAGTGRPLWSAAAHADAIQRVPEFAQTLASAPRVLDLDGDGHLDRAYLIDLSGGLWRFDFARAAAPADLATAGRIARLGDGSQQFQSAPDVAIARIRGRNEIAISAGSGRIDRPRDAATVDRAYVILDRGHEVELSESDLHDATDRESAMPPAAPGWYLRLDRHGAGEKVAGPALTFDHVLRFQTYQPLPQDRDAPCGPPRAMSRLYARDIRSGLPATRVTRPDDAEELEAESAGLPVALRYGFPPPSEAHCPGCRARPYGILGTELFDAGYAGDPVRTSWRKLPLPASR